MKYGYSTTFLDEQNEFSASFIGLWLADGHFSRPPSKTITITSTDKDLIDYLVKGTKYKNKITWKKREKDVWGKRKDICTLSFRGPIVKHFEEMDFIPGPKTGKEFIPTFITDNLFPHFLRLFIDGDGNWVLAKYIHKNIRKIYVRCRLHCANKLLLKKIHLKLKKFGIVKAGTLRSHKKIFVLTFGHGDSISLGDYIYKNATIYLKRKYNIYLKGKETNLIWGSQKNKICSIKGCERNVYCKNMCNYHYYKSTPEKIKKRKEIQQRYENKPSSKIKKKERNRLYRERKRNKQLST